MHGGVWQPLAGGNSEGKQAVSLAQRRDGPPDQCLLPCLPCRPTSAPFGAPTARIMTGNCFSNRLAAWDAEMHTAGSPCLLLQRVPEWSSTPAVHSL